MKKIALYILILLFFTGCSYNNKGYDINPKQSNTTNKVKTEETSIIPTVTPIEKPTTTLNIIQNVSVENNELLINIKELSKSPRRFDTNGESRACNYLIDKMREYGYQTKTQEFNVYEKTLADIYSSTVWQYFEKYTDDKNSVGKGTNLIVTTPNPDKKKTMYITAHYDTTKDTNGIRDNASGVAVAMEIAKQLQESNLQINIEFVFFSGEEAGMQGSSYFVSNLTHEEKENALGCINIDVVGEKGDNTIVLKTNSSQINVLSLLMDEYHTFIHSRSEASDHFSFYMGEIPAIYFADNDVKTKDTTENPQEELDVEKLKDLTIIICNFILDFNLNNYNEVLKNSFTKGYTDFPDTKEISGYSLIQVNKILREDGAGSDTSYIWENDDGNQAIITEKDSRFLNANLVEEIQSFASYNDYTKYHISEEDNSTTIKYADLMALKLYELKGNVSKDQALDLLNNQGDVITDIRLINALN